MKQKRYAKQILETKEVDRDNHTIKFVLSTPSEDRHGEIIDQKGWKLDNYMKNPVVLFGHDQSKYSVGQMIELGTQTGNLEGTVKFAYEENKEAATLFELYAGAYMRAGSVGFMNYKWMYDEESDTLTILENELYEFSLVNVPANAEALMKAATEFKEKNMDKRVIENVEKMMKEKKEDLRFKDLGEEVKDEATPDEAKPDKPDEGGDPKPESEPKPDVETPKEETPGETGVDEPINDEHKQATDEEVEKALEVLLKAKSIAIIDAMSRLRLEIKKEADKSKVETTPVSLGRKYSVDSINRVIRLLMNSNERVT